ncbi:CvfB family protein [Falsibacillus albus]|uniref:S1 RNA-binding domain-containing protein n=1 Tax=Falsibacillus albus TaxID=2478915 RepID=A0A3L7JX63_9BACI|nr:S1 RNA-binding domain-containing protein [Falsibacillus albus]RLQ95478.1 S1 RNA-binding domain-containing protein [Falsibacillus albus]
MRDQLEAGMIISLRVEREAPFGYFLSNGVEDVLLHRTEVKGEVEIDQEVDVFLYHDKQGRITATMTMPTIQQGEYDWCKVVGVNDDLGVFVDIGIAKDVLVSADDLPIYDDIWPAEGDLLYMTLTTDRNGRLYGKLATENIIQELVAPAPKSVMNQDLKARVYRLLKVGTFVITEEGYRCFIHESERKEEPRLGQLVDIRVIDVKDDGSLNGSLMPRKQDKMKDDSERIFDYLLSRKGSIPYWDKSQPEDIEARFEMSKGAFKRALGKLMKEGKIYQEDGWTHLKLNQE